MDLFNTVAFPKLSIIMPTYNRAGYIGETIASVRDQTYTNWELIIVDDGSDDNTEEIIAQLKDERISFYKAGRVAMPGKIKNIGLSKATGDLIAFIDSDDLWAPGKMEKQIAALAQCTEAGFSLTGGYNFREKNKPVEYFYKQKEGMRDDDVLLAFFKAEVAATVSTLVIRKQCVEIAGIFEESQSLSDMGYLLRLAMRFKAVILYEPLFYRRLHDSNYSSINWVKRHYDGIEMFQSYKNIIPGKVIRDALFRSYINFGEQWLQRKKSGKAIHQFFRAWKIRPLSIVPLKKTGKAALYFFRK
jgi:glycosyltransferase involved in cell wall biosynthesis